MPMALEERIHRVDGNYGNQLLISGALVQKFRLSLKNR
jgi:hypothetical protein